jgi:DNA polymerase-3 subunit alpha
MAWYIWETCDKKKRLTLQNMPGLIKHGLLPEENAEQVAARRVFEFNRYLKKVCIDPTKKYYRLDTRAMNFLLEMEYDNLIDGSILPVKTWDKIYQKWMDVFRNWISENKTQILQKLNDTIFKADWDKYAAGTLSAWEMEVLCFYYHEHELAKLDTRKYGYSNFNDLPTTPIVTKIWTTKNGHTIKKFQLYTICGTCIAKDKIRSTVTLLTTTGVVDVKFRKEYFALFDKQISAMGTDGVKHVIEKSWFSRGNMLVVQGIRMEDTFIPKKYADTGMAHQLYRISEISEDGTEIKLQSTRAQGEYDEED